MRRRVHYSGRVQGVGFRATARHIARGHPVTGWVRNEPDGSVLLEVQGAEAAVGAFLEEVRGTMGGYIRSVDESALGDVEGESGFEVRR